MRDYDMYADEFELEYENEFEYDNDEFEYEGEFEYDDDEFEYEGEFEYESEYEFDDDEVFDEDEELELAETLLSVGSEEELEHFLGSLIKKGFSTAKNLIRSRGRGLVRKLTGKAKRFAGRLLPQLGRRASKALGKSRFGKVSGIARKFFGFELEMVGPEEQELEVAKKIVGITKSAARNLAKAASRGVPPTDRVVKAAMKSAIKKHIGSRRGGRKKSRGSRGSRSGSWVKRGNKIILSGV